MLSRRFADLSLRTGDPRKWWVLFSVAFGAFMAPLDSSIVNTVLPIISHEFRADVFSMEWVVLAYLLTLSSLLLIGGRLGDLFGDKPLYIAGFAVFTLSSMLCGLATGVGSLVASRVLQSVGEAMMIAIGPASISPSGFSPWAWRYSSSEPIGGSRWAEDSTMLVRALSY